MASVFFVEPSHYFFVFFSFCKIVPTRFARWPVFFFFFLVKPSHLFFRFFSAFARSCRQDLRDGQCDATIHANRRGQSGQRTGAYVKTYHGKQGTVTIWIYGHLNTGHLNIGHLNLNTWHPKYRNIRNLDINYFRYQTFLCHLSKKG